MVVTKRICTLLASESLYKNLSLRLRHAYARHPQVTEVSSTCLPVDFSCGCLA
jgi:hypothetical protein